MTHREKVFAAIDGEFTYQQKEWGDLYNDEDWSIGDWLIFMERYVEKAKNNIGHSSQALCEIRKVAALAVKCLMHHGVPSRADEEEAKRLAENQK